MIQKIIKYYIVLLVVFLSWVSSAHANLEITEINNPEVKANHCWIKVYNNDSKEVNLTEWFVMDDDGIVSPKPWHYHTINADGSLILAPNSYAIIANSTYKNIDVFKSKNPNISGPLFYGSLTFKDEGNMGLSKDKKIIIGQKSYGITYVSSSNNFSNSSEESDTTNETLYPVSLIKENLEISKITTKIISPKTVVAGIPFSLSSLTTTNTGKIYNFGKFIWNFGDGMIKQVVKSEPFEYVYEYPGDYVLSISYFDNSFNKVPDATDRIIIKVIPSDIYISGVGNEIDPYIELENKSNYEIVLSGWTIIAGIHGFIFPEGTSLLSGKKIKLSPKITGFTGEDIKLVFVMSPDKKIVSTYPDLTKKVTKNNLLINKVLPVSSTLIENNKEDDPLPKDSEIINLNDLEANASKSGVNISNSSYPFVLLFIVIGLGLASFLIIKKKKDVPGYVERGIRAEDMTILE